MNNLVFSNFLHRPARTIVSILGIAIGVLLIVFTVDLANGSMRERAQREANVGAEIFFRPSGSVGISGSESFILPMEMADEIEQVEGVLKAVGIGQNTVEVRDSKTGERLIDVIVRAGAAPSKREARRLFEQGAVSVDGDVVGLDAEAAEDTRVQVGKRRWLHIVKQA